MFTLVEAETVRSASVLDFPFAHNSTVCRCREVRQRIVRCPRLHRGACGYVLLRTVASLGSCVLAHTLHATLFSVNNPLLLHGSLSQFLLL